MHLGTIENIEKSAVANLPLGKYVFCRIPDAMQILGKNAVSLVWKLEATTETSPVFIRPPKPNERRELLEELIYICREIDSIVQSVLYGENVFIKTLSIKKDKLMKESLEQRFDNDENIIKKIWYSYAIGVVFGRWNPKYANDILDKFIPDNFLDNLPHKPIGSFLSVSECLIPSGIATLDEGHSDDLPVCILKIFYKLNSWFPIEKDELRSWLNFKFFQFHLSMYSQSGRKAPIYWQLSTTSTSYSIWLYYHRFTKDTFYKVLNDFVTPKVQHEERELTGFQQEYGPNPTGGQRKEIATQETFVEELRAFRKEVTRIAPLWNPNLNDGVIINFAPLWRLVPQLKSWQKECKKVWDKLVKGDYDWAHLAMHLWPERVVPKCLTDRSLAIAHELEDNFWYEADDGKWYARNVGNSEIDKVIEERTSASVKAALEDLLSAPVPSAKRKKRKK
jgi:hypothetical protein